MNTLNIVHLVILISSLIFSACTPEYEQDLEPEPQPGFLPEIIIEGNTIKCKYCDEFGWIVEAVDNEVFVADSDSVYIFEDQNGGFLLMQEIGYENGSRVNSMHLYDNFLFIGVAEPDGTGVLLSPSVSD